MRQSAVWLFGLLFSVSIQAMEPASLWSALAQGGHVALMRHALAPGTGDPSHFQLENCATQRNLNNTGREQARQIGAAFRNNKVNIAKVYTSQWCRCRETAELLDLGSVKDLPILNSFFSNRAKREPQTEQLREFLADLDRSGASIVMVTHQVNITALTDYYPASGEILVLRLEPDGRYNLQGSLKPY